VNHQISKEKSAISGRYGQTDVLTFMGRRPSLLLLSETNSNSTREKKKKKGESINQSRRRVKREK